MDSPIEFDSSQLVYGSILNTDNVHQRSRLAPLSISVFISVWRLSDALWIGSWYIDDEARRECI